MYIEEYIGVSIMSQPMQDGIVQPPFLMGGLHFPGIYLCDNQTLKVEETIFIARETCLRFFNGRTFPVPKTTASIWRTVAIAAPMKQAELIE